jgi:hypothetical protein
MIMMLAALFPRSKLVRTWFGLSIIRAVSCICLFPDLRKLKISVREKENNAVSVAEKKPDNNIRPERRITSNIKKY